jgi:ketosteroid isomerase-like protein
MSRENVELAMRGFEAFNRRDLDAFLALCDPEVEVYSRLAELEGGRPYRGHDGVRSWWDNIFALAPDIGSEIDDVEHVGDMTLVRLRARGHGVGSDAPIEQTQWLVTKWHDQKAVCVRIFLSEAQALEATGLSE